MMSRNGSTAPMRGFSRIAVVLGVLLVSVALMEVGARLFWRVRYGIPLSRPDTTLHALYPERARAAA